MRKKILVKLLFIVTLFTIQPVMASFHLDPIHNSDYYKDFRKNESPKGIVFKELVGVHTVLPKNTDDYTIYKKDSQENGYYFKVLVHPVTQMPIATSFAAENKEISKETTLVLINASKELLGKDSRVKYTTDEGGPIFSEAATKCVIRCNRESGCYDKPNNLGASLCSLNCNLDCDKKTKTISQNVN